MGSLISLKGINDIQYNDFSFSIENETNWTDKYLLYFPKEIQGNFYIKDSYAYEFDDNFPVVHKGITIDNIVKQNMLEFLPDEVNGKLELNGVKGNDYLDLNKLPKMTKSNYDLTIQNIITNFSNINTDIEYNNIILTNTVIYKQDLLDYFKNIKVKEQLTIIQDNITIQDIILNNIIANKYRINNKIYDYKDVAYIKRMGCLAHLVQLN